MSVPPDLAAAVQRWFLKAAHDLKTAEHTLLLPDAECPFDTICFHAQQCAEKSLKAFLVLRQVPFDKTHDLGQILYLCRADAELMHELMEVRDLTHYAVDVRYAESVGEEPGREEAIGAVALARKAYEAVKQRLRGIL